MHGAKAGILHHAITLSLRPRTATNKSEGLAKVVSAKAME